MMWWLLGYVVIGIFLGVIAATAEGNEDETGFIFFVTWLWPLAVLAFLLFIPAGAAILIRNAWRKLTRHV